MGVAEDVALASVDGAAGVLDDSDAVGICACVGGVGCVSSRFADRLRLRYRRLFFDDRDRDRDRDDASDEECESDDDGDRDRVDRLRREDFLLR